MLLEKPLCLHSTSAALLVSDAPSFFEFLNKERAPERETLSKPTGFLNQEELLEA